MSSVDYLFSLKTENKALSIDSISLHIDLAYMLGNYEHLKPYCQWLALQQDSKTGFFWESFSDTELLDHPHPRVKEMVGTYLGFQVSSLFLRLSIKAKEFKFWRFLLDSEDAIDQYLEAMPWARSPWGAGGWVDSLGTMIYFNCKYYGDLGYQEVFNKLLQYLVKTQSLSTGLWGSDKVQGIQGQVNGAYHLLRGTFFLSNSSIDFNSILLYDSIIDYCSSYTDSTNLIGDACNDLDLSYLLYKLNLLHPAHRIEEVRNFSSTRLNQLCSSLNSDGLFGFFRTKSQDFHNYHNVGPSLDDVTDVQGVVFYLTTLFYLTKILEPESIIPWTPSLTHG